MANGIDWFRWHHGSVTDPKFALLAKRCCTSVPNVIAVWAYLLEQASAAEFRGCFGEIDCEALDCLFGMTEGTCETILEGMDDRKLIADQYIVNWEKRQPKRVDETAADRKRRQREREHEAQIAAIVTDEKSRARHAMSRSVTHESRSVTQGHDRGEESREEKEKNMVPKGTLRFSEFWNAWPKSARKGGKPDCLKLWQSRGFDGICDSILAHVAAMSASTEWQKDAGQFIPAPVVYLRGQRWDGAEISVLNAFEGAI